MSDNKPQDHYHDPLLSRLYDSQNPWGPDCDFFLSLIQDAPVPRKVLDVGCGTGLLTAAFANLGYDTTGIDPASDMLNIARHRQSGDKVSWVQSDAAQFKSDQLFDLIILSGHAFQVFLTDQAIHDALSNLKALLSPNGKIAFDTRNLDAKAWERWIPKETTQTFVLPANSQHQKDQKIEIWHDLGNVERYGDGRIVEYFTLYRTMPVQENNVLSSGQSLPPPTKTEAKIRFLSHNELLAHLDKAGLVLEHLFGDWNQTPLQKDSREMIVVARN
ncbi:class I SAM-dependent methyltransferase [Kiloniella sp.]|uniref:class I SAM-dependent methyltransferase n=1 Tax=Kiloniella sp. TaxID=1938587 RepID=UPI003A93A687